MNHAAHALMIFAGGGAGSVARWLLSGAVIHHLPVRLRHFPFGILTCNLLGCLLIGMFFGGLRAWRPEEVWRSLLVTGFLGGFTTFSTFAEDTHRMFQHGPAWGAAGNVILSVVLGLGAVWCGHKLGWALVR